MAIRVAFAGQRGFGSEISFLLQAPFDMGLGGYLVKSR